MWRVFVRRNFHLNSRNKRNSSNLVPQQPTKSKFNLENISEKVKIDSETIALLERLSLVDCANKEGIKTLEDAIQFADRIKLVKTDGIQPLVTVLEDKSLRVRQDNVAVNNTREDIFKNAQLVEEDYFVAPPGNIPLES